MPRKLPGQTRVSSKPLPASQLSKAAVCRQPPCWKDFYSPHHVHVQRTIPFMTISEASSTTSHSSAHFLINKLQHQSFGKKTFCTPHTSAKEHSSSHCLSLLSTCVLRKTSWLFWKVTKPWQALGRKPNQELQSWPDRSARLPVHRNLAPVPRGRASESGEARHWWCIRASSITEVRVGNLDHGCLSSSGKSGDPRKKPPFSNSSTNLSWRQEGSPGPIAQRKCLSCGNIKKRKKKTLSIQNLPNKSWIISRF